jgi:hypothetical protein
MFLLAVARMSGTVKLKHFLEAGTPLDLLFITYCIHHCQWPCENTLDSLV